MDYQQHSEKNEDNFWFTRIQANKAAIKAMIVNRIGDFGLALGMMSYGAEQNTVSFWSLVKAIGGGGGIRAVSAKSSSSWPPSPHAPIGFLTSVVTSETTGRQPGGRSGRPAVCTGRWW